VGAEPTRAPSSSTSAGQATLEVSRQRADPRFLKERFDLLKALENAAIVIDEPAPAAEQPKREPG